MIAFKAATFAVAQTQNQNHEIGVSYASSICTNLVANINSPLVDGQTNNGGVACIGQSDPSGGFIEDVPQGLTCPC